MPNHVTTRCEVTGPESEVARFSSQTIHELEDEDGEDEDGEKELGFDFDRIIKFPKILAGIDESRLTEEILYLFIMRAKAVDPFEIGGLSPYSITQIRNDLGLECARMELVVQKYFEKYPDREEKARHILKAILETGCMSWYQWRIRHWGTKWNSYNFKKISDAPLVFVFDTAWSFPTPIFERLSIDYPSLHFQCWTHCEGANFAGQGFFNPPPGAEAFKIGACSPESYFLTHGVKEEID